MLPCCLPPKEKNYASLFLTLFLAAMKYPETDPFKRQALALVSIWADKLTYKKYSDAKGKAQGRFV